MKIENSCKDCFNQDICKYNGQIDNIYKYIENVTSSYYEENMLQKNLIKIKIECLKNRNIGLGVPSIGVSI